MSITRRFANLGTALDSASTSHFLSVLNKEGLFRSVLWTEIAERPNVLDSADVSSIIIADVDKAFVDSLGVDADTLDDQQGAYYLNYDNFVNTPDAAVPGTSTTITTGDISNIVDSDYVQRRQSGAGFSLYEYTATDGQTTFGDSDIKGAVLAYADGYVLVHYNGVLLSTTEYTATNGDDVILQDAADSGAVVMIAAFVPGQAAVYNPYADPAPTSIGEGDSAGSVAPGGSGVWYGDRALIIGGFTSGGPYGAQITNYIEEFSISNGSNASQWGTYAGNSATGIHSHSAFTDGSRMVIGGGYRHGPGTNTGYETNMYYRNTNNGGAVTSSFGSLGLSRQLLASGASDGTNGFIIAGNISSSPKVGEMQTVVIQTTGDATTFGELGYENSNGEASGNNSVIIVPLSYMSGPTYGQTAKIKYFATGSQGNATDFGFLTSDFGWVGAVSDDDYCVMPCTKAKVSTQSDTIEYVTIATPGNATDFGNLLSDKRYTTQHSVCTGDGTYGVITANYYESTLGNNAKAIEKITLATPGNAVLHGGLERYEYQYNHEMCSGS